MGGVSPDLERPRARLGVSVKVLLVSPYDSATPGGVTNHVFDLSLTLMSRGHQVSILAPFSGDTRWPPPPNLIPCGDVTTEEKRFFSK